MKNYPKLHSDRPNYVDTHFSNRFDSASCQEGGVGFARKFTGKKLLHSEDMGKGY